MYQPPALLIVHSVVTRSHKLKPRISINATHMYKLGLHIVIKNKYHKKYEIT